MIPAGWEIPSALQNRLGKGTGRQRAMLAEGHLLLVLHKVPGDDPLKREGVYFWRDLEGNWHSSNGRGGVGSLQTHIESYLQSVETLENRFDKSSTAAEYFEILEKLVPLERASANLSSTLQTAQEALPDVVELVNLRDLAGDADRGASLLHSAVKNALNFYIARQNEEQARLTRESTIAGNRLNIIAAFFLPMTALSGAFGMNLPNGLPDSPLLFWLIFGSGSLFGAVLGLVLSRPTAKR